MNKCKGFLGWLFGHKYDVKIILDETVHSYIKIDDQTTFYIPGGCRCILAAEKCKWCGIFEQEIE